MLPAEIAKARAIESSRPLKERLADEATTEPVAATFQEWLTHPNELDLPRVDVKSPLTFNKEEYFSRRGWVDGKVEAFEDGEYVGHIGYTWTPCDFHIELVHVKPEHRGKGCAAFMLREVINQQDKLCIPASLEAQPFAGEPVPSRAAERNQMGVLKELYGSFGFEPHIGNTKMTRMPVCRTKREKERLMRECEDARREWERLESRLDFPVPKVKPGQMVEVYYPVTGDIFKAKAISEPVEKGEDIWKVKIIDKAGDPAYAVWSNKGGGFVYGDVE